MIRKIIPHNYIGTIVTSDGNRHYFRNKTLANARRHFQQAITPLNVIFAYVKERRGKILLTYCEQLPEYYGPVSRPKKFPNLSRLFIHRQRRERINKLRSQANRHE